MEKLVVGDEGDTAFDIWESMDHKRTSLVNERFSLSMHIGVWH